MGLLGWALVQHNWIRRGDSDTDTQAESPCEDSEKAAICKPEREALQGVKPVFTSVLGLLPLELWKNKSNV